MNKKWLVIKRLMDLAIGLPSLLVLGPVILTIAILIRLDSKGNPFFLQEREGRNRQKFKIFKFRTLFLEHFGVLPDEEVPHPRRITRIGKYLRRSKLDELPQLINVILGDMSIVGPRPCVPFYIPFQNYYTSEQIRRLAVKPGLTGIPQISGNVLLQWDERIWLDVWYIENWSWQLDVKIITLTFTAIYRGEELNSDPLNLLIQYRTSRPDFDLHSTKS